MVRQTENALFRTLVYINIGNALLFVTDTAEGRAHEYQDFAG
jgi:hypothetical protein